MKNNYVINPELEMIPDVGLGDYIVGYSTKGKKISYLALLWLVVIPLVLIPLLWNDKLYIMSYFLLILPIIGIVYTIGYYIRGAESYYIYTNGFVWQKLSSDGKVKKETAINFKDVSGIKVSKTRHYTQSTFITTYNSTTVDFKVYGNNGILFSQKSGYKNEYEKPEKYNAQGYAIHTIVDKWNDIALERANQELSEKGYVTFNAGYVKVGRDFLKVGSNYVEVGNFKYAFDEGMLYIYPESVDGLQKSEPFSVDVNSMTDSDKFLMTIGQLLDIK